MPIGSDLGMRVNRLAVRWPVRQQLCPDSTSLIRIRGGCGRDPLSDLPGRLLVRGSALLWVFSAETSRASDLNDASEPKNAYLGRRATTGEVHE